LVEVEKSNVLPFLTWDMAVLFGAAPLRIALESRQKPKPGDGVVRPLAVHAASAGAVAK
jgi:hypothetical protein